MLYLDIETRSQCDLIKHGLARYAQDPTTEVICMAWAFDDEDVKFWWADEPFPAEVEAAFAEGEPITAHNAEFERWLFEFVICADYNLTVPRLEQWRCSMVQALTNGFAGGLDTASQQAGVPYHKHKSGTRLIREYSAPGHKMEFTGDDAELMKLYNILDVEVMRALVQCCRPLTQEEWSEYHLTCRINQRGIPVDVEFADAALGYAEELAEDADKDLAALTGGMMTKHTQRKGRDAWLFPRLTERQKKLLVVYKKGEKKTSLDQDRRDLLLDQDDLDHDARQLLELINNAGSSALKKFAAAYHQHVDGRVHNTFLFNGAGRTGRFSGKGLQPHNMRRDVFEPDEADAIIDTIRQQYVIDRPATTMARLLRAMIHRPEGIYWVDWSAIEGRVAPWLGNSLEGERKLDLYRENRDVYVVTAADMFGYEEEEVDGDLRQSGKISELSLQFGGANGALIGMAKNYGVVFSEAEAEEIVRRWRRANAWAPMIWGEYQYAIDNAVLHPGEPFEVGRVTFQCDGSQFLWCRLPSGRLLSYPRPRFEEYETPWGEVRYGPTFQTHYRPPAGEEPVRLFARGALLFQNTVQATAADVLRRALRRADEIGLDIIGHVHDEIIGQGDAVQGELLNGVMLEQPEWAEGLPLATGGVSTGRRYGK